MAIGVRQVIEMRSMDQVRGSGDWWELLRSPLKGMIT